MAKKASGKSDKKGRQGAKKPQDRSRASPRRSGGSRSQEGMGDAFIKLLQSPLVAELVAVAATAALASLAEHGFTSGGEGAAASAPARR